MSKKNRSPRMTRRDFTKVVMTFLGTIMGAIVGIPAIGYLISPAVKEKELDDILVIGGGIIPDEDIPSLKEVGISEIFGPGIYTDDIVTYIRNNLKR